MKYKGILSLILVAVLCMGICIFPTVADAEDNNGMIQRLTAFGIIDDSAVALSEPVSRIEMVGYATKLYGFDMSFSKGETGFKDVTAEHELSGNLNFAVAKKIVSQAEYFYPDRNVTFEEGVKMIVSALDYSEYAALCGGYPEGYINVAYEIGLLDNVKATAGATLTMESVIQLLSNALDSNVCSKTMVVNSDGENEYVFGSTNEKESVLKKRFGISTYEAFITDVSNESVKADILSADKNDSASTYKKGDKVTLYPSAKAKLADCKYTYSKIYVTEDNIIVGVEVNKNTEIITGCIAEINKSALSAPQDASYIENIAFERSEDYIDVAENCTISFNGEIAQKGETHIFIDAFARAVLYKDEIIAMEVWELTSGGLVAEAGDINLKYTKGEAKNVELFIGGYKNVNVYLNGVKSDYLALVDGILFDWYADDDMENLLIVASSNDITDTLDSVDATGLYVGGEKYNLSTKHKVFYSTDGISYYENINKQELLGRVVMVHLDFSGKVRYVRALLENELGSEVYAIITGFSHNGISEPELQAFCINEGSVEKKVFSITQKVVENKGSIIKNIETELTKVSKVPEKEKNEVLKQVSLLYKIRINKKNQVVDIKEPTYFAEPTVDKEKGITVTEFPGSATAYISSPKIYFPEATICAFYYSDDLGLVAKTIEWRSGLFGMVSSGIRLDPYAKEKSSDIELMLVRGNVEALYLRTSISFEQDFCNNIQIGYDKATEKEVLNLTIGGKTYTVSKYKDKFAGVTDAAYLVYSNGNDFLGENEIIPLSVYNMSGNPDNWNVVTETTAGIHKDTVEKVDSKRVYFTSGDVWYMLSSVPIYKMNSTSGGMKFVDAKRSDITEGMEVWYIYYSGEIQAMFYM